MLCSSLLRRTAEGNKTSRGEETEESNERKAYQCPIHGVERGETRVVHNRERARVGLCATQALQVCVELRET
jgi:hypothetical protein